MREMNSTLLRTEKSLIEEKEKRIEGELKIDWGHVHTGDDKG